MSVLVLRPAATPAVYSIIHSFGNHPVVFSGSLLYGAVWMQWMSALRSQTSVKISPKPAVSTSTFAPELVTNCSKTCPA